MSAQLFRPEPLLGGVQPSFDAISIQAINKAPKKLVEVDPATLLAQSFPQTMRYTTLNQVSAEYDQPQPRMSLVSFRLKEII